MKKKEFKQKNLVRIIISMALRIYEGHFESIENSSIVFYIAIREKDEGVNVNVRIMGVPIQEKTYCEYFALY